MKNNSIRSADKDRENKAAVMIQAHFKGKMARELIEKQYGFKSGSKSVVTADATEARERVQQIRRGLPKFDYNQQRAS